MEKTLTDKLACFIVNYPYEFIQAILRMAQQEAVRQIEIEMDYEHGNTAIPTTACEDTDMSYKIKQYMPQIAALRKERGA